MHAHVFIPDCFKVCKSYPEVVVVPSCISDGILRYSSVFRHGGRFPVLSYRHQNGVRYKATNGSVCIIYDLCRVP